MGQNDKEEYRYPAIRQYDNQDFERFKRSEGKEQHNIMMLVGNGFDISVLNYLKSKYSTDYKSFFYYLKSINFNENNVLFRKMDELRIRDEQAQQAQNEEGRVSNWSDFEWILQDFLFLPENREFITELIDNLREIQYEFSNFLNFVVSPELLSLLDEKSREFKWGYRTYGNFAADLEAEDYENFSFPKAVCHYHVFNFNIINFNYTTLLDNYLYLDRDQFNPRPHETVDTNFKFRRNPRNYNPRPRLNSKTTCSAYLVSEIYHPHGIQQIPRSLLFGIDGTNRRKYNTSISRNIAEVFYAPQFEKILWAQTPLRYEKLILETELFIIFGSSRGGTDKWWWKNILRSIYYEEAELIIYEYSSVAYGFDGAKDRKRKDIKDKFIEDNFDELLFRGLSFNDIYEQVYSRIFVVIYSDSLTISAFGFCDACFDPDDMNTKSIKEIL